MQSFRRQRTIAEDVVGFESLLLPRSWTWERGAVGWASERDQCENLRWEQTRLHLN